MPNVRASAAHWMKLAGLAGFAMASACAGDPAPTQSPDFSLAAYPAWRDDDAAYRFYPGDRFRIDVRTAPELSGELTVGPDGRVSLPVAGPIMAGGKTARDLQTIIEDIYRNELRDPSLVVTPTAFGSQKVFVGGEVKQPGAFDLPGEIDVMQAILLAGGWTEEANPSQIVILRRRPGGDLMTRVVDVRNGLARQALYDIGPLKRFDVVYVTRSAIADENRFVRQYIRNALPIDFSLFYDVKKF